MHHIVRVKVPTITLPPWRKAWPGTPPGNHNRNENYPKLIPTIVILGPNPIKQNFPEGQQKVYCTDATLHIYILKISKCSNDFIGIAGIILGTSDSGLWFPAWWYTVGQCFPTCGTRTTSGTQATLWWYAVEPPKKWKKGEISIF